MLGPLSYFCWNMNINCLHVLIDLRSRICRIEHLSSMKFIALLMGLSITYKTKNAAQVTLQPTFSFVRDVPSLANPCTCEYQRNIINARQNLGKNRLLFIWFSDSFTIKDLVSLHYSFMTIVENSFLAS